MASPLSEESLTRRRLTLEEMDLPEEVQAIRKRAAAKITKYMRSRYLMYANFGPLVFCKCDGNTAEFGTLVFPDRDTRASFISVADMSSAAMLANFVEKYWKCSKPEILISVTGGAQTFDLKPWLKRAFETGFVRAARDAKAWVVTGGTDAGVMELVATAMHNHNINLPVFGFTPLGCVNGRKHLHGCRDSAITYQNVGKASAHGAPLNPHHTHFVLVDSGKEAPQAWGTEIDLRYRFEEFYAVNKHVPIVQVVVQGGPGTLDNMLHAAKKSCPIVIVADSGGAATAVFRYCAAEGELTEDDWEFDELMKKFVKKREVFTQLRDLNKQNDNLLLHFFSPLGEADASDSDSDLSAMLLNSIVNMIRVKTAAQPDRPSAVDGGTPRAPTRQTSCSSSPAGASRGLVRQATIGFAESSTLGAADAPAPEGERALMLAVKWDRPDVVRKILDNLPGGIDFKRGHRAVVQTALELQRTQILELFMKLPEWTVEAINLTPLYRCEDQYQYFRSDAKLQAAIYTRHREIYSAHREESHDVYRELVGKFMQKASPLAADYLRNGEYAVTRPADLFFWAALAGIDDLMKKLWSKTDSPIVVALLASHLCRGQLRQVSWGKEEVEERADMLEQWATGVLDAIPKQNEAFRILGHQHGELWGHHDDNLLDLALRCEMKSFLAHRYCTALMDEWWRGGLVPTTPTLPQDFSYATHAIKALFPVLVLYDYWRGIRKVDGSGAADGNDPTGRYAKIRKEEVMDAVAMTMKYSVHQHTELNKKNRASEAEGFTPRRGTTAADLTQFYKNSVRSADDGRGAGAIAVSKRDATWCLGGELEALQGFYSVPATKFVLRLLSHILLLMLYGDVLVTSPNMMQVLQMEPLLPPIRWQEIIFSIWAFGIFADEADQGTNRRERGVQNGDTGVVSSRFETMIDFGQKCFTFGLTLRWLAVIAPNDELARALYIGYQETISLDVILISLELLSFLSVMKHFGVLVIMITEMVQDMISFFQLFALVIFAFSLSFIGLSSSNEFSADDHAAARARGWETHDEQAEDVLGFAESLADTGWIQQALDDVIPGEGDWNATAVGVASAAGGAVRRLLKGGGGGGGKSKDGGGSSADSMSPPPPVPVGEEGEADTPAWYSTTGVFMMPVWAVFGDFDKEAMEESLPYASWLMWIYVLVSNVVLVNLLVAMLSDTYAKVKENSMREYHYQHMQRVYTFAHVLNPMPPPTSLPLLMWRYAKERLYECFGGCCRPSRRGGFVRHRNRSASFVNRENLARKAVDATTRLHMEAFLKREDEECKGTIDHRVDSIVEQIEQIEDARKEDREYLKQELKKLAEHLTSGGGSRGGRARGTSVVSAGRASVERGGLASPRGGVGPAGMPSKLDKVDSLGTEELSGTLDEPPPAGRGTFSSSEPRSPAPTDLGPALARLNSSVADIEARLAAPPAAPEELMQRLADMEKKFTVMYGLSAQLSKLSEAVNSLTARPPSPDTPAMPPGTAPRSACATKGLGASSSSMFLPSASTASLIATPRAPERADTVPEVEAEMLESIRGSMDSSRLPALTRQGVSGVSPGPGRVLDAPGAGREPSSSITDPSEARRGAETAPEAAQEKRTPRGGLVASRLRKFSSVPQPGEKTGADL